MKIKVNGKDQSIKKAAVSVSELLKMNKVESIEMVSVQLNGNFIDKTSSIVANILLQIIPTTSGEKRAFTYYRDGAI